MIDQQEMEGETMEMDEAVTELLKRRDLTNFLQLRNAHPGDDPEVGALLVKTFRDTNAVKMPGLDMPPEREKELRDVSSRRMNGVVRVIELGLPDYRHAFTDPSQQSIG
ncbi:MAG: hypothetical protein HC902_08945 [Calothrix sp. SM1_5_4]|nr:hypothetical protein [Calothrix sp. SM1_5_4]